MNAATANTDTCSSANNIPAKYFVRNNRSRLIGFETNRSIDPPDRKSGKIPAVVYGEKEGGRAIAVDPKILSRILRTELGANTLIQLKLGGSDARVLVKEYQIDPVTHQIAFDKFLFWDNIHPTAEVQAAWAEGLIAAVPEPPTLELLAMGAKIGAY